jgi:hypothetical protein
MILELWPENGDVRLFFVILAAGFALLGLLVLADRFVRHRRSR